MFWGRIKFYAKGTIFIATVAACLAITDAAAAYTTYYNMSPDGNKLKNKLTRIDDIIGSMYDWKGEDFVGSILPSQHEAIVYRAISKVCGGAENVEDCWIAWEWLEEDIDLNDDDEFWGCIEGGDSGYYQESGFSDADDADDNCNVIGHSGLDEDVAFRSLLAGSRWPDLKGMPAMMADNTPDLYSKDSHNNPQGQASRCGQSLPRRPVDR